jgi:DNA-binding CsgD family transcriptional regulator
VLFGRATECERLLALLEASRAGTAGVLVLDGEPGVGKSALLGFARENAGDALVLSTVGAESESGIPHANLADLVRPVVARVADLPARQAQALTGALALGPAEAGDRFGVAAATLSLLGMLAAARPVLVLVDDAQWVDPSSREALAFAVNRLQADRVAVLVAAREGTTGLTAFDRHERLRVTGLHDEAARELVRSSGHRLAPAVSERLVSGAGGNPLALRELPGLLTPAELAVWSRGQDPVPIASALESAFGERVGDLPRDTQEALLVIATLGPVPIEVAELALVDAGLPAESLEPAERAGLLVEVGDRFEFRHPLVRAAVHQRASARSRRRAHVLAAATLVRAAAPNALQRRSWHLVAAGGRADETLARALEDAATEELRCSRFAVASTLMERSAQLTTLDDLRAPRLFQAADSARLAGTTEDAHRLLLLALEATEDPRLTVAVQYYLARIEMWRGSAATGRDQLLELAALVEPFEAEVASRMLSDAALASVENGDFALAAETSAHALEVTAPSPPGQGPDTGTTPDAALPTVAVRALALGLVGDAATARALLEDHAAGLDLVDAHAFSSSSSSSSASSSAQDQLALVAALAHLAVEDVERAGTLLERSVAQARAHDAVGLLPFRLGRLAWVQLWQGRWAAARSSAAEAVALAEDTGWVAERPSSLAAAARVEAAMGLAADCRAHAAAAEQAAAARGTRPYAMHARVALGLLALGLGDDAEAVEHLETVDRFAQETGLRDTPLLWWSGDLVEAYVRRHRLEDAARVVARLESQVDPAGRPVTAAVLARCRALVRPLEAEQHLVEALRLHGLAAMPFEHARTQLQLGLHLRRRRQRADARVPLRWALETFERLGAAPWAERARLELGASGVALDARPSGLSALTPQEFQVAQNVAHGLSNREVAAAMFLSVKTVEYHLGNVFDKLGVRRRSQVGLVLATGEPAPAAGAPPRSGTLATH